MDCHFSHDALYGFGETHRCLFTLLPPLLCFFTRFKSTWDDTDEVLDVLLLWRFRFSSCMRVPDLDVNSLHTFSSIA